MKDENRIKYVCSQCDQVFLVPESEKDIMVTFIKKVGDDHSLVDVCPDCCMKSPQYKKYTNLDKIASAKLFTVRKEGKFMNNRKKIEKKIEDIKQNIQDTRKLILELESDTSLSEMKLEIWEEALKMIPKQAERKYSIKGLHINSNVYKALDILRNKNEPMKTEDILKEIGEIVTEDKKILLSQALSRHVRKNNIFTRPERGVFGLKKFNHYKKGAFK